MITDIQQAASADMQEKIAETHEYLQLEEELARRHQTLMERRVENAIKIGQNLCYFKATLPHGKFIPFVQTEFGMSQPTAWRYTNLAEQSANHSLVNDLDLSPHMQAELAMPSMPVTVIEMVETKQIPPTVAAIREAKREVLAQEGKTVTPRSGGVPLALQMSESNEWYTPAPYVNAARELMDGIDVDPASNAYANRVVQAAIYYDSETNGFTKDWIGRVWLNPPYGWGESESNQELWSRRLLEQYRTGITTEAVLLVNAVTDRKWFQPLWQFPICFTDHRIRFYNTEVGAGQPTHGNALIYLGLEEKLDDFIALFRQFGPIVGRLG